MTFDLDVEVNVTPNVAQYPLHHVTYAATKFLVPLSNGLVGGTFTCKIHYLTFDLGVKVTLIFAQYSILHVIYAAGKYEVATSNSLGGDAFTRKNII